MGNVESYLNELSRGGTERETLNFTIDQAQALHKLSRYQLPDRALWIVKMVQAAVRGEATEIDVRLGKRALQVKFDSPLLSSASELFDRVRSGELPQDPFWLHLLTGIRASFAQPGSTFVLQTVGAQGRSVVVVTEEQTTRFTEPEEREAVPTFTFLVRRPFRTTALKKSLDCEVSHLLRGTADEHMALLTRCWASPVPLRIDGKLLDTRYDSPLMFRGTVSHLGNRYSRKQILPRLNLSLKYYPPQEGKPALKPDRFGGSSRREIETSEGEKAFLQKPVYLDGRFFEWAYERDSAGMVLINPLGMWRRSAIYFVQDGALVQRVPISLRPPIKILGFELKSDPLEGATGEQGVECLVVPVDFNDLDLSHFKLRDAEARRRDLLNWIGRESMGCRRTVIKCLRHFYWLSVNEKVTKVGLTLAGLATIPIGVAGGAAAAAVYSLYQGALVGTWVLFGRWGILHIMKQNFANNYLEYEDFDFTTIEQPPVD